MKAYNTKNLQFSKKFTTKTQNLQNTYIKFKKFQIFTFCLVIFLNFSSLLKINKLN